MITMKTVNRFLKDIYYKSLIVVELMKFLWENKLWWGIPIILIILLIMVLVIFAQGTGLAPFIYPLF